VGVEQHLVALAGVGHQPEGPAGAQLQVRPSSTPNPDFRRFPRFNLNEINELEA
jgi:hypothetical protein